MILFDFLHNNFKISVIARYDVATNNIFAITLHVHNPTNLTHTASFPFEIPPELTIIDIKEIRAAILNWSELDNIVQKADSNFSVLPPADPN